MTMASPLRGPTSPEGGGFAAAHLRACRAGYGAAPPASRVLRIALARDSPAGCPGPRRPLRPLGREERQAQACPAAARGAQPPAVAGVREHPNPKETYELAFDTHKEEKSQVSQPDPRKRQASPEADPSVRLRLIVDIARLMLNTSGV
jgi:hypothetical protein